MTFDCKVYLIQKLYSRHQNRRWGGYLLIRITILMTISRSFRWDFLCLWDRGFASIFRVHSHFNAHSWRWDARTPERVPDDGCQRPPHWKLEAASSCCQLSQVACNLSCSDQCEWLALDAVRLRPYGFIHKGHPFILLQKRCFLSKVYIRPKEIAKKGEKVFI